MDSKRNRFALVAFVYFLFSWCTFAGTISLSTDISLPAPNPDPNEEITAWIHTDESLLFMSLGVYVNGDATITSAMSEADCNDFGWQNGWGSNPEIDPNGWVRVNGLTWAADANDIVGYFKFRYNSGQVYVYIDQENSLAGNWGNNFTFSDEALLFGQIELPPLQEPNEPTPLLIQCPLGSSRPQRGESENFDGWTEELGRDMEELDSEPNIIEIDSDITTNQIWTSDNNYYITAETVNVQALLVIEPNTLVIFGYNCAMLVNNGGTLSSRGTPDKPIIYTCDGLYFYYPERLGYYWFYYSGAYYYYCPIYIEETASPATTITYSFIEGATVGITTENIRLDNPIENNYLFGNRYGILEYGSKLTDIRNNLCFFSDYSGIEVYLSDASNVSDANSIITIENNTCDAYQYCGITVHGAADANEIPTVNLLNNIVSESYWYGLNIGGGPMWLLIANTGYFDNWANKNIEEIEEYNPVEANDFPYTFGERFYEMHYLVQDCNFIDAGVEYIEQTPLIGMTTDANSVPDYNFVDLGFHYPNWDYSSDTGGFTDTDFDINGITDVNDLLVITDQWLDFVTPGSEGDLNTDGEINFTDFALFAANWQNIQGEPNMIPIISGDPNTGWIDVGVSGYAPDTQQMFLLADGKFIGDIFGFQSGDTRGMDISEFGSGIHDLKVIGIGTTGDVACSYIQQIEFPSFLTNCMLPQTYEPNEPLYFAGNNTETEDITVNVYADGGDLVWSQTYNTANGIFDSIPAEITAQHEIDYVVFSVNGEGFTATRTTDATESLITSGDLQALIILPDPELRKTDAKHLSKVQKAFKSRGIKYKKLVDQSATFNSIRRCTLSNPHIKYLYIDAHGDCWLGDPFGTIVYRTWVQLANERAVSLKRSDFVDPNSAPPWCADLEGWENRAYSFLQMGFANLEFVQLDVCFSGRLKINAADQLVVGQAGEIGFFDGPHSDMSIALGIYDTSESRVYQGWYKKFWSGKTETDYQKWTRIEWERLGEGDYLYDALWYTVGQQTEFNENAPVNNYRLKGQGSLGNIRLSSN
jgi:hypothetical protein